MLRSRTKGVPSTSGDPQPPRREFSTRLFGKSKNRGKGNAQSSLDQNSLGETKYQVFGSLVQESVEETGGGECSASTKNPRDNDSVPFATSQTLVSTPPTMEDIDRWTYHTDLQNFGQNLQIAANAVFPNDKTSRYEKVSVLMLSWADEDPKLPVSLEVESLASVFQHRYNYNVEQWRIPEENCHFELAAKVMTFVEPESDSKSHLKIVYYAGHARLLDTRALALTRYD